MFWPNTSGSARAGKGAAEEQTVQDRSREMIIEFFFEQRISSIFQIWGVVWLRGQRTS